MRLNRRAYRISIIVHVAASVAWLGLTAALILLGLTARATSDARLQYATGTASALLANSLAVPVGAVALASGVLLMFGTRWTWRYKWVLVKLIATAATFTLTVALLGPATAEVAAGLTPDRLVYVDQGLFMGPIVSTTVYLVLTAISYVKPWGRIGAARPKPVPERTRVPAGSAR